MIGVINSMASYKLEGVSAVQAPHRCRALALLALAVALQLTLGQETAPPSSLDNVISYELLEEQQPNTLIGNIIVDGKLDTQYPSSVLDQLRFNFLPQSSIYKDYFVIEERTGLFRTQKTLDRDEICSLKEECVLRLDVALQPVTYFQILKVSVKILDINDNYPTFPEQRVPLFISETTGPGASFAIPGAEDGDTGSFSVQGYQLVTPDIDVFELKVNDETDGNNDVQLLLKQKLDREVKDSYELKIIAKDGGIPQKTGTIAVDITVVDANDNTPRFENRTYTAFVYENIPTGSVILSVRAIDEDDGENGEIVYDFSRTTKNLLGYLFGINSYTGEIFPKDNIDFEENAEYTLGVMAQDKGPNALSDFAKVVIHVWDVNDHAPKITTNAMSDNGVQVEEGADLGTFVAHISVFDPDGGINGEFTCSLDGPYFKLIQLFPTEYKVVSDVIFDRETRDQYQTALICQDKGKNTQTTTEILQIEITDANDHAPKFVTDTYAVTLRENNGMGDFVTQLNATDRDIGMNAQLVYSIEGDHDEMLKVDPTTGIITTNGLFDYEERSQYRFTVVTTDLGIPQLSATATLTITVLDTNDEVPKFPQKTYSFGTFENQATGTEIGTLVAYDRDTAPFNNVVYTFDYTKGDVGIFKIDPHTGKITSRKVLDREEKDTYKLTVIARNDGQLLSSKCNVTIYIADQNDNAPVVTFPSDSNNTAQVSTFASKEDPVTTVQAEDHDIGSNAQLTYSILGGNNQDLFIINPMNGMILVNNDLTNYAEELIQLTILVQDSGDPLLSTLADMYIHINSSLTPIASPLVGHLSETNLVIIICLSIIAVVLLVFVLLVVLVFRRRRVICYRGPHNQNCTCKKCRVRNYVQYEQTQAVTAGTMYNECSYGVRGGVNDKVEPGKENSGFQNGNAVYLQMDPAAMEIGREKKPNFFSSLFPRKAKSSADSDKSSMSKKRKVHFAEGGEQPGKAYQAVSSVTSSPSRSPLHAASGSSCPPDLLQQYPPKVDNQPRSEQGAMGGEGWQEEPRQRLLYRAPPQQQQLMPLQVQSLLNTTPPDAGDSDQGSSCDSGRGPSEEEPDHSRHSNNFSDPCLFPAHAPHGDHHHHASPSKNPNIQHVHCSCKPDGPNRRDSFNSTKSDINAGATGTGHHGHQQQQRPNSAVPIGYPTNYAGQGVPRTPSFQDKLNSKNVQQRSQQQPIWSTNSPNHKSKCECPHDPKKCVKSAPAVPRRLQVPHGGPKTGKPLPDLPEWQRDNDSQDGDSEGESTTTSGSYMVDTTLDLSMEGPQISPCDVYV